MERSDLHRLREKAFVALGQRSATAEFPDEWAEHGHPAIAANSQAKQLRREAPTCVSYPTERRSVQWTRTQALRLLRVGSGRRLQAPTRTFAGVAGEHSLSGGGQGPRRVDSGRQRGVSADIRTLTERPLGGAGEGALKPNLGGATLHRTRQPCDALVLCGQYAKGRGRALRSRKPSPACVFQTARNPLRRPTRFPTQGDVSHSRS